VESGKRLLVGLLADGSNFDQRCHLQPRAQVVICYRYHMVTVTDSRFF
jgi:hypothetical protein